MRESLSVVYDNEEGVGVMLKTKLREGVGGYVCVCVGGGVVYSFCILVSSPIIFCIFFEEGTTKTKGIEKWGEKKCFC